MPPGAVLLRGSVGNPNSDLRDETPPRRSVSMMYVRHIVSGESVWFAQTVHPRMGQLGTGNRALFPLDRRAPVRRSCRQSPRCDNAGPRRCCLLSAVHAFPSPRLWVRGLRAADSCSRFSKRVVGIACSLPAHAPASRIQPHLGSILRHHLLDLYLLPARRASSPPPRHRCRARGSPPDSGTPAPEPLEILLRRRAAVHHDQRSRIASVPCRTSPSRYCRPALPSRRRTRCHPVPTPRSTSGQIATLLRMADAPSWAAATPSK